MFIPLPTTIIMSDAYSFGQTAIIQCPFTMILQSWILVVSMVEVVRSLVVLRDGGYEGVTIAFHSSIQEDPKLVENVKSLVTSASAVLYQATGQRAYFRDVTILVPSNWSPLYDVTTGGSRFGSAEIRVDRPNPEYGNNPYTLQPGGCGEPGLYIHLTPEFILDLHGTITEEYGDPGRTLIHEWAHLRYGVFDEYGDWEDFRTPPFYMDDDGQMRVTGCASKAKGAVQTPGGAPCTDPQNCVFKMDNETVTVKSSLMFLHFLPTADGFCGQDEDREHNAAAPNKQNLLCQGKSTWDIISNHPDFSDGRNPPRPSMKTTPIFRVLQPKQENGGNYVLLLDVSGSMAGGRMSMLRRSATRFIKEQIPDRSKLGIVAFSTKPRILKNLTEVHQNNRRELALGLPFKDDGGNTGIGPALTLAMQVLRQGRVDVEGSAVILISDGEENIPPYVHEVKQTLVDSRVVINTIAFGKLASTQLEGLVTSTGGRGFFYEGEVKTDFPTHANGLESALFASTTTQADVDFHPVEIVNKLAVVNAGQTVEGYAYVDEELRANVKFTFGYALGRYLTVILFDPHGEIHTQDNDTFRQDVVSKIFVFQIPMASAGQWTYVITNSKSGIKQGIGITVTAEPVNVRQQPIRIRAWMNDVTFQLPKDVTRTKVYAEVHKSYVPILDALVMAIIERPKGHTVELLLKDDGIGPDMRKDDGVYTAHFSQFNGTGRYAVTARVVNDGKAYLKLRTSEEELWQGSSAALSKSAFLHLQTRYLKLPEVDVPLGEFQRTTDAGSFRVTGWSEEDSIPPGRVTDLRATISISGVVTLTWTSPGDDLDFGNATRLDVRVHRHGPTLISQFESGFHITESHLVHSKDTTLRPSPGGQLQEIRIIPQKRRSSSKTEVLYFALRALDDSDNVGEVSNLAFVLLKPSTTSFQHQALAFNSYSMLTSVFGILTFLSATLAFILYRLHFTNRKGKYRVTTP